MVFHYDKPFSVSGREKIRKFNSQEGFWLLKRYNFSSQENFLPKNVIIFYVHFKPLTNQKKLFAHFYAHCVGRVHNWKIIF